MKITVHFFAVLALVLGLQTIVLSETNKAFAGPTLDATLARGSLLCSTAGHLHTTPVNYEKPGSISGFDRDFCRAIAAAVLNDKSAIEFIQLVPKNRFQALQEGAVDILVRSTTWTYSRDTSLGVHFAAVNFYDGQGFIAPKSLGISSLKDLRKQNKKATACVEKATTSRDNVDNYINDHDLPIEVLEFNAFEELRYAFITGRCNLFTADRSYLVEVRNTTFPKPDDYVVLEDVISKEPLATIVRDDDAQWLNIVRWVVFATIQAEELGITSANADALRTDGTTDQRNFLGAHDDFGASLGLDKNWAYQVVKAVGNYGEIFDRNLGLGTIYNLDRGINDLWTRGGLMYAPPFH